MSFYLHYWRINYTSFIYLFTYLSVVVALWFTMWIFNLSVYIKIKLLNFICHIRYSSFFSFHSLVIVTYFGSLCIINPTSPCYFCFWRLFFLEKLKNEKQYVLCLHTYIYFLPVLVLFLSFHGNPIFIYYVHSAWKPSIIISYNVVFLATYSLSFYIFEKLLFYFHF